MTDTTLNLPDILDKHRKWRLGQLGGERADLSWADLSGADLSWANLSGAIMPSPGFERIPAPELAARIIAQAEAGHLNMERWHTCKTTHCAWGWATVLNGDAGQALEEKLGIQAAGALLFPEFSRFVTATDADAMIELRRIAGLDTLPVPA